MSVPTTPKWFGKVYKADAVPDELFVLLNAVQQTFVEAETTRRLSRQVSKKLKNMADHGWWVGALDERPPSQEWQEHLQQALLSLAAQEAPLRGTYAPRVRAEVEEVAVSLCQPLVEAQGDAEAQITMRWGWALHERLCAGPLTAFEIGQWWGLLETLHKVQAYWRNIGRGDVSG